MNSTPALSGDAAVALGIAATAMPFARTAHDQASRWLRVLRGHGEAGRILASMGVAEAGSELPRDAKFVAPPSETPTDPVAEVTSAAGEVARQHGREVIGTCELLRAVIDVYGETFERVLQEHGATSGDAVELLDDCLRAGAA